MSFDWQDFLVLARELAASSEEAKQRTSISRAYYGAYHAAARAAATRSAVAAASSRDRHTAVWNCWAQSKQKRDSRIGNMGLRLKQYRREADYDSNAHVTPEKVHKCIKYAEAIIRALGT